MISESSFIGTDRHAVVPCVDIAIFNKDTAAAVNIKTVGVHHKVISPDGHVVHMDIFAIVEEAVPVLGVFKADISDPDIAAAAEKDHLRHAPLGKFVVGMVTVGTNDVLCVKDGTEISINSAFA